MKRPARAAGAAGAAVADPKLPPKVAEAVKYMAAGDHAAAAAALEAAGHHDHAAQQWVYAKMPARADMAQAQHEVLQSDYAPSKQRPVGFQDYKEAWQKRGQIPQALKNAGQELVSGEAEDRLTGHPTPLSSHAQKRLEQEEKYQALKQELASLKAEEVALQNPEVQPGFAGGREGVRRPLDKVTAATASPTAVPPGADPNEAAFRAWYAQHAKRWGLDPNPDAPEHQYDYRAAFNAGATPDKTGHWPSEFKLPGHPNRFVDGVDTITMKPVHKNVVAWAPPETGGPALYQQYLEMQNPARRYMPPAPVQPVMYRKAVPGPTMENQNIDVFPTLPKPPAG